MWLLLVLLGGPVGSEREMHRALSVRHEAPSCAALALQLGTDRAIETATHLVETEAHPPWVPLRAVGCLVEWSDRNSARRVLEDWLERPGMDGVAVAVAGSLGRAPEAEVRRGLTERLMGRTFDREGLAATARRALDAQARPVEEAVIPSL